MPSAFPVDETNGRTTQRVARVQGNARDIQQGLSPAAQPREVNLNRLCLCQLQFHPKQSVAKTMPCVNGPLVRNVLLVFSWLMRRKMK
jgi:hypothetical protein